MPQAEFVLPTFCVCVKKLQINPVCAPKNVNQKKFHLLLEKRCKSDANSIFKFYNAVVKLFIDKTAKGRLYTSEKNRRKILVKMPRASKRTISWTAYLLGADPSKRFFFTGLKGVLIGLAISLENFQWRVSKFASFAGG